MHRNGFKTQAGFTLVEIVVGLVVLGAALVLLTTALFPQAGRSAEPVLQMRAAELGQAFMNEISSKPFNRNSDRFGGFERCDEQDADPCNRDFGQPTGTSRADFTAVEDFHGYTYDPNDPATSLENALGDDISDLYRNFTVAIDVCASDAQGDCFADPNDADPLLFKRVLVTITTPQGQAIEFATIRGNY